MPKQRLQEQAYALVYAAIVPVLQDIAREHGYALAVHGSMATDLDLLAAPWTETSSDAETLANAIRNHLNCVYFDRLVGGEQPVQKPHGRLAWTMYLGPENPLHRGGPYIDLSVMPKTLMPSLANPDADLYAYCLEHGHDWGKSGTGFDGEHTTHWAECTRCGFSESD